MSTSKPAHVRDWLKGLGALVASTVRPQEVEAKLNAYVPMLLQEFRVEDFTALALRVVARQCEYLPSFKLLCDLLKEHTAEQALRAANAARPALPAPPPPPPRQPPTDAERAVVAEMIAALRRDLAAREIAREAALTQISPPTRRPVVVTHRQLAEIYARTAKDPGQPNEARAAAAQRLQMLGGDEATSAP